MAKVMFDSGLLVVVGDTLPDVWESSVEALYNHGYRVPTEYDTSESPMAIEAAAVLVVDDPIAEPRIHRGLPCDIGTLLQYADEVLFGTNDHLESQLSYTYHGRIRRYGTGQERIDQLQLAIDKLRSCYFTRRAQVITWMPAVDNRTKYPPCLQRIWFSASHGKLNMHVHMRSNDALNAAFMNMYAFTELQRYVAGQLGICVGQYKHIVDSYHIYGNRLDDAKGFIKLMRTREYGQRVWTTDEAFYAHYGSYPMGTVSLAEVLP